MLIGTLYFLLEYDVNANICVKYLFNMNNVV